MTYRPITDVFMLVRPKVKYYGAYPAGFLERARFLLGVTIFDPVLHICSGMIREYQSGPMRGKGLGPNDRTIDLDPDLKPDFCLDVRKIGTNTGDVFPFWTPADTVQKGHAPDQPEFRHIDIGTFEVTAKGEAPFSTYSGQDRRPWAAALVDRPYTPEDAAEYNVGASVLPPLNDLLKRSLSLVRVGGRVGVLDYYFPRPPSEGVTLVACIGVTVGWGNRMRCFSVFERTATNPLEYNTTTDDEPHVEVDTPPVDDEVPDPTPSPAPKKVAKKKKKAKKRDLPF